MMLYILKWCRCLPLAFIFTLAYAQNPTQGPLQYDPNLHGYGYGIQQPDGYYGGYQSPPAQPIVINIPSKWGAGAMTKSGAIGRSVTNRASEEAAIEAALADCHRDGNGEPCQIVYSYSNQCIAVFLGRYKTKNMSQIFFDVDLRAANAEKKALKKCRSDKNIISSSCELVSGPECSYACHPDDPNCFIGGRRK